MAKANSNFNFHPDFSNAETQSRRVFFFTNTKCTKETKAFVYSVTCFSLLSLAKKFRLFCVFRVQIKFFVHSIFATSAEGATLNRAVRKGCHIGNYSILRSEGPTPIVLVFRCRTYSAPFPTSIHIDSPIGLPF